jgi:hypothetical protein
VKDLTRKMKQPRTIYRGVVPFAISQVIFAYSQFTLYELFSSPTIFGLD